MKKPPGNKWKTIPYGSKIIKARTYEPDDNTPNKRRARQEAKMNIKKEIEDNK